MILQYIVTTVIVLLAFGYVARMMMRMLRGRGGCGCGSSGGCPKSGADAGDGD